MTRAIALFDFDGTLTRRDSLIPFLAMVRRWRFGLDLAVTSPWLTAYVLGVLRNENAKQRLLTRCLGGMELEGLRCLGERFAKVYLPGMLRSEMVNRLHEHQQRGDRCVLVSASLDIYLKPWADSMGFEGCLSSQLEVDSKNRATGRLRGGNCFGEEKVRRIQALVVDGIIEQPSRIYAYGDSRGDWPMLAMADEGYRVTRDSLELWDATGIEG